MNAPKISKNEIEKILTHFGIPFYLASLVFIRGYFLDSEGKKGANDDNLWDDACALYSPNVYRTFRANTDPSFIKDPQSGAPLARLNLGKYKFYRGLHKGKQKALRAFPEGVRLACTRNGQPSTCSYINCHSGSADARAAYRTWSHGCLTLPGGAYYDEWQRLVYREIAVCQQEVVDDFRLIDVVLIENKLIGGRQQLVDDRGNRIF